MSVGKDSSAWASVSLAGHGGDAAASLSSSAALPTFLKARERGGKGTTDPASAPLPEQIASLAETASALAGQVGRALGAAQSLSGGAGELAGQGIVYAAWVVEALAARRGVALSKGKGPKGAADGAGGSTGTAGIEASLDKLLADAAANVDRIERLPSPYLWKVLADLEARATEIAGRIEDLGGQLAVAEAAAGGGALAGDGSSGRRGTMGGRRRGDGWECIPALRCWQCQIAQRRLPSRRRSLPRTPCVWWPESRPVP